MADLVLACTDWSDLASGVSAFLTLAGIALIWVVVRRG